MNRVSVIIPSRNGDSHLLALLDSLRQQTVVSAWDLEIVIALDGVPASPELLTGVAGIPHPTRLLALPQGGATVAKNRAVNQASGNLLLFLNDDVVLSPGFLEAHLRAQEAARFNQMILGHTDWTRYPDETVMDALIRSSGMIFFYDRMQPGGIYDYRYAWTLNLSMPRRLFEKAGGFAEALSPCMPEDIELAWRIQANGHHVVYCPEAHATHNHRYTWEAYLRREIMLGLMAPVLWDVNPECFRNIYSRSLDALVGMARQGLDLDQRDDRRAYQFLADGSPQTVATPPSPELLKALYLAHIPVKRRTFRYGLLAGIKARSGDWRLRSLIAETAALPDCLFENPPGN